MAEFDAIVVGGGIVGATAALALADSGRRVAVIERRRPELWVGELGYDPRSVALNEASRQLLEELGVWRAVPSQPITQMRVWEEFGTASVSFDAGSVGVDALAWVVEAGRVVEALWARCATTAIEMIAPAELESASFGQEQISVVVDGREMSADLIIGADGASSKIRELAGARLTRYDTSQKAFATVARFRHKHEGRAFQRFGASGPVALLPLPGDFFMSVIWSVDDSLSEHLGSLSSAQFRAELERATESVMGEICALDSVAAIPLAQALVDDFNPARRVLVIGDAARTIHPMAGQGVNLGLEDVRGIRRSASVGGDLGASGRWRGFTRRRQARARFMLGLMAGFDRAYGQDGAGLRWLRNIGVRLVDSSPLVKRQLIREAMGLGAIARSL